MKQSTPVPLTMNNLRRNPGCQSWISFRSPVSRCLGGWDQSTSLSTLNARSLSFESVGNISSCRSIAVEGGLNLGCSRFRICRINFLSLTNITPIYSYANIIHEYIYNIDMYRIIEYYLGVYTVYTRSIYWMSYLFFCKSRPFGTAVPPGPERKLWPRAVSPAPERCRT